MGISTQINLFETVLQEYLMGDSAIVYHRSQEPDYSKYVMNKELMFKNTLDGDGIYCTYDLQSQMNPRMIRIYGNYIQMLRVRISRMIILDYDVWKQTSQGKQHPKITDAKGRYIDYQLQKLNNPEITKTIHEHYIMNPSSRVETSQLAHIISAYIMKQYPSVAGGQGSPYDGIIFTGRLDGKVCVLWNSYNSAVVAWAESKDINDIPKHGSIDKGGSWHYLNKSDIQKFTNANTFASNVSAKRKKLDPAQQYAEFKTTWPTGEHGDQSIELVNEKFLKIKPNAYSELSIDLTDMYIKSEGLISMITNGITSMKQFVSRVNEQRKQEFLGTMTYMERKEAIEEMLTFPPPIIKQIRKDGLNIKLAPLAQTTFIIYDPKNPKSEITLYDEEIYSGDFDVVGSKVKLTYDDCLGMEKYVTAVYKEIKSNPKLNRIFLE